ncbi:MAG: tryptophan-rich sensory protein [Flavobacteriales bacterium]|nr:tryptophan-rich sensory protein [Flavobacteriales bacterium]
MKLAWSVIFFGLRSPTLAQVEKLLLLFTMIACTRKFFTIRRAAGWLKVPYIAWVTFATALNAGIVLMNP